VFYPGVIIRTIFRKKSVARNSKNRSNPKKPPPGFFKFPGVKNRKNSSPQKLANQLKRISPERKLDILGIGLALFGLLSLVSLFTGSEGSLFGAISMFLQQIAGYGAFLLPIVFIILGIWLVFRNENRLPLISSERLLGITLLTFNLFTWMHKISGGGWELVQSGGGGGVLGAVFERILTLTLGDLGSFVVLLAWSLVALALAFDIAIPDLFRNLTRSASKTKNLVTYGVDKISTQKHIQGKEKIREKPSSQDENAFIPLNELKSPRIFLNSLRRKQEKRGVENTNPTKPDFNPQPGLQVHRRSTNSMARPPLVAEMLDLPTKLNFQADLDKNRAKIIEETLASLGAPSKVVEIHHGPTFTQFCLEPGLLDRRIGPKRVGVNKISNHAGDVALSLSVRSVRMETPVPGKSYIGIEVPNNDLELVTLREGMESESFRKKHNELMFVLGKDVSGRSYTASLADMPHLLIAGSTGTGKSVCLNSILTCYLLQYSPDELKLLLIDPKRVELTNYNGIPHLMNPVIVDAEKVPGYLKWLVREMDRRLEEYRRLKVRDITEYNATQKVKMPFIVLAIDELATLMMLSPVETEIALNRLAEMARATGIHIIIATQRPSVDVITGKIKANFPTRIAFAVVSGTDSRVGIDKSGADRLVGKGDMLFHSPEMGVPKRLQGVFVSDHEIERVVQYWQKVGEEQKKQALAQGVEPSQEYAAFAHQPQIPLKELEMDGEDEMLQKAIEIVRHEERASISLLQRKLSIGYMRAARMVEKLEQMGIIGKPDPGSGVRPVLDFGEEDFKG
jgi:DNA segregation ATPase FtsK/SpoIIIE, S-DNA-T family